MCNKDRKKQSLLVCSLFVAYNKHFWFDFCWLSVCSPKHIPFFAVVSLSQTQNQTAM